MAMSCWSVMDGAIYLCRLPFLIISEVFFQSRTLHYILTPFQVLRYVLNGAIYLCRLPILVISEVFFQSCTALYSNPFPDVEESKDDDVLLFQLLPKFHGRRYVSNKNPFLSEQATTFLSLHLYIKELNVSCLCLRIQQKKQVRLRKGVKNTQVFFKTEGRHQYQSYVFFRALGTHLPPAPPPLTDNRRNFLQ